MPPLDNSPRGRGGKYARGRGRVAALTAELAAARALVRHAPPAISRVAATELPDAVLTELIRAAITADSESYGPLYVLQHNRDVPVVQRFVEGVRHATEGRMQTVEDVLRCRVASTMSEDAAGAPQPPAEYAGAFDVQSVAHFVGFHGTKSVEALCDIAAYGFDPTRRAGQALGPGEYFGRQPNIAQGYDVNQCLLVSLLLRIPAIVTNAANQASMANYVVVNNHMDRATMTYCLPVALLGPNAPTYGPRVEAHRTSCPGLRRSQATPGIAKVPAAVTTAPPSAWYAWIVRGARGVAAQSRSWIALHSRRSAPAADEGPVTF